jgi:choline-sulfatase
MSRKRPNVLFLMTDQHRFDVAGFSGDPTVRTPNLDRLAEDGVVFTNAYAPAPICVASRQCMAAGQLPKTCNCVGMNDVDVGPNYMTLPRRFSQYGYKTVCAGKLHILGEDQMQGWRTRIAALSEIEVAPQFIHGLVEQPAPREPAGWNWTKELQTAGPGVNLWETRDRFSTEGALQYIDMYFNGPWYDRQTPDQPLFLKLSLSIPHYPYRCDTDRFRYYINRVSPYENQTRPDHPGLLFGRYDDSVTPREIRRATAAYYGLVEQADDYCGLVLESLEEAGQDLDDWIILFTSDHGEMLGEHGIFHKVVFYEGSARVPLFIRMPKRFAGGRRVDRNVNLCDLFATLCELCDLPVPENLDSRSMVPLLEDQASATWSNETVSTIGHPASVMIKQDHLKYLYYESGAPEILFDLEEDPGECRSFSDDPSYAKDLARFRKRLGELGFGPDAHADYVNAGYTPIQD